MAKLVLRGVESDDELRLANSMMSAIHSRNPHEALQWLESSGAGYPGYRREHTRIVVCNGEVAAALRLTTDTLRLGEARLKTGGLGWVTTAGHHRHKGFARELIRESLQYMARHGYHLSMLFGIPNFYQRFGFTTSLADYTTVLTAREAAEVEQPAYRLRKSKPGDIRAIQKMHNANDADIACSLVRTGAHIANRWNVFGDSRVLTNAQGKVVAYFMPQSGEEVLRIMELGVTDRLSCGALLHACAQMAGQEHVGRLQFDAPPSHPFIQYLVQFKSTHQMRVQRNEGGMMAFVNLPETLEMLLPEWENLVQGTAVHEEHVEVTLLIERSPYRVRAHRGAIDIAPGVSGKNKVSLSSAEFMHLVTGYRYCEEILSVRRRTLTASARTLLHTLFPKRTPFVWAIDRF